MGKLRTPVLALGADQGSIVDMVTPLKAFVQDVQGGTISFCVRPLPPRGAARSGSWRTVSAEDLTAETIMAAIEDFSKLDIRIGTVGRSRHLIDPEIISAVDLIPTNDITESKLRNHVRSNHK